MQGPFYCLKRGQRITQALILAMTPTLLSHERPIFSITVQKPQGSSQHRCSGGLNKTRRRWTIDAGAVIEDGAVLADNVWVGAGVWIGCGAQVGENSELRPGVRLYHNTVLGSDVLVHANTVIGSDGFGFAPVTDGWGKNTAARSRGSRRSRRIGANCAIDRGAWMTLSSKTMSLSIISCT